MKILITGGAGFIGSWVANSYISEGHKVLIIDNLSTGRESNIPKEAEFLECDICEIEKLRNSFKSFKPDVINHHAAQINVRNSMEDPAFDAKMNIIGSINLLQLSKEYAVKKVIVASSGGAIYGEPVHLPADEETTPNPLSPYGTSKLCMENYLNFYKRIFNLEFTALRYSNVYGERQNPEGEAGVVSIFCTNILNKIPCKIFGDGTQTRDYVHCSDVADANIKSLYAPGGTFNIGTAEGTSVNTIVEILHKITDHDFQVEDLPKRIGEVQSITLDNKFAKKALGWIPKITFSNGLKQTYDWFVAIN